jgi:Zn-dependent M28 family amino/carboxypeptidase
MVVLTEDSAGFVKGMEKKLLQNGIGSFERRKYYRTDKPRWEGLVLPAAVPGLPALLAAQGVDLSRLRADTTPVVRELPSLQVSLDMQFGDREHYSDTTTAPNVVGMIEGSDSALKGQYVVFSAHMDGRGVTSGRADSIDHGADDNAAGTAALIALAKAFSQPGARPRRSVLFVATSGGVKPGLWGSHAFVESFSGEHFYVPGRLIFLNLVAAVNLDMIGRGPPDSVTVDGLRTMNFKVAPDRMAAAHPELRLAVVDGGTIFRPESDHFSFATNYQVIPSLSFHTGRHGEPPPGPDVPAAVNAEQVARIARLVFYVSQELVNDIDIPHLNSEGRRQMIESQQ